MSRRILVTGGGGFIGQAVRRRVEAAGDVFLSFDSPCDVREYGQVYDAVMGCDGVINLAGLLGTSETLGMEQVMIDVNVRGALLVASAAERHKVPMVQIGTGHRGQPNVYAITKACAEDLILARVEWGGLEANVVRAYHAYGPGQKAPSPYGRATVRKIVPAFVCAALAGDPLVVNGSGLQTVDLVHVDDVAEVLVLALDGPYGRTVEAGTGHPTSVLDAAHDVIAACGSLSAIEFVPMRLGEPQMSHVVANNPACRNRWPDMSDTIPYYRGAR